MKKSKTIFVGLAIVFFIGLGLVVFDFSQKTSFPAASSGDILPMGDSLLEDSLAREKGIIMNDK